MSVIILDDPSKVLTIKEYKRISSLRAYLRHGGHLESMRVYHNWINASGEFFYTKGLFDDTDKRYSEEYIINELYGSKICMVNGVNCIDQHLALIYDEMSRTHKKAIVSKSFANRNIRYYAPHNLDLLGGFERQNPTVYEIEKLRYFATSDEDYYETLNNFFKSMVIDFFMNQKNRNLSVNMLFTLENKKLNFGPMFDFEISLKNPNDIRMQNYCVCVDFNPNDLLYSIFNDFPDVYNLFIRLLNTSFEDLTSEIEDEEHFKISAEARREYLDFFEKRQEKAYLCLK